jgi:hypothetical protein
MPSVTEQFLKHFDELMSEGNEIDLEHYSNENYPLRGKYKGWKLRCLTFFEKAFGTNSDYYKDLKSWFDVSNPPLEKAYAMEILLNGKKDFQLLQSSLVTQKAEKQDEPSMFLERLFSRYHLVARQLRERYDGRQTLDINDEYDVQDLVFALLRINFDNIRKEEWTPSYACGCSRMDFLLKNEGIVVEVKKTRIGLTQKELADQLIVDMERYQAHPDCKVLFCFIYDPEGRIGNPEGIEELSKPHGNIDVIVLVAPKGK